MGSHRVGHDRNDLAAAAAEYRNCPDMDAAGWKKRQSKTPENEVIGEEEAILPCPGTGRFVIRSYQVRMRIRR